jgi:hypothetical protein
MVNEVGNFQYPTNFNTEVKGLSDSGTVFDRIYACENALCAVTSAGVAYFWGKGDNGGIRVGDTNRPNTWVSNSHLGDSNNSATVSRVHSTSRGFVALLSDGTIVGNGFGYHTNKEGLKLDDLGSSFVNIYCGHKIAYAVKSDGTMHAICHSTDNAAASGFTSGENIGITAATTTGHVSMMGMGYNDKQTLTHTGSDKVAFFSASLAKAFAGQGNQYTSSSSSSGSGDSGSSSSNSGSSGSGSGGSSSTTYTTSSILENNSGNGEWKARKTQLRDFSRQSGFTGATFTSEQIFGKRSDGSSRVPTNKDGRLFTLATLTTAADSSDSGRVAARKAARAAKQTYRQHLYAAIEDAGDCVSFQSLSTQVIEIGIKTAAGSLSGTATYEWFVMADDSESAAVEQSGEVEVTGEMVGTLIITVNQVRYTFYLGGVTTGSTQDESDAVGDPFISPFLH